MTNRRSKIERKSGFHVVEKNLHKLRYIHVKEEVRAR
jgi:hypothetical protein